MHAYFRDKGKLSILSDDVSAKKVFLTSHSQKMLLSECHITCVLMLSRRQDSPAKIPVKMDVVWK